MREIPETIRFSKKRFVKVLKNRKKPFEDEWQKLENAYRWDDEELSKHIENGGNVGVLCENDLIIIDADTPELQHRIEGFLPVTYRIKSPRKSGGVHNYFHCEISSPIRLMDNEKKNIGDILSRGKQALCPPSQIDGVHYKVLEDSPIATIKEDQLKIALFPYMVHKNPEIMKVKPSFEVNLPIEQVIDLSALTKRGNEYFGVHPVHGSEGGSNFWVNPTMGVWHCFRHDTGGGSVQLLAIQEGIIDCSESISGAVKGNNFRRVMNAAKEKYNYDPEKGTQVEKPTQLYSQEIQVRDINYFLNLKKDKRYIVDGFLYPGTLNMLYSPPGGFKSSLMLWLAMAVTNKRDYFGMKTKRFPVLICDKENNDQVLKERLVNIRRGHKIRNKKFPLYFITRNGNLDDSIFLEQLDKVIEEKKIQLIVFDTLRRFSNFDENDAGEVNKLYGNVFQPLIEKHGCSILLLHHTNKSGEYRGSIDLMGMLDTAYSIKRRPHQKDFKMVCEKSRYGEIETFRGEIDFNPNYIKFSKLSDKEEIKESNVKLREVTTLIEGLFPMRGYNLARKDIVTTLEIKDPEIPARTIDRCLSYLFVNDKLSRDTKGKYTRMW